MKLAQVLTFASTLATFANAYSFSDNLKEAEPKKESTGLTVNEESRIYGGKEVDIDNYPFAVNLRIDLFDASFCGGALIAPQWVLTAGHCIKTDEYDILAVLGSNEREGNGGEQIEVVEGFRHPGYNKKKHLYDIGLLKLAKPSKHEAAKMCTKDGSENEVGNVATIVGWGLTEKGKESDSLLGVNVEIIPNAECNKRYDNRITEGMMCAGHGDGKDSCNGDSGGPLVVNDTLVGIASWGRKCGARPGVYTRLPFVMDYIDDILNGGDGSKFGNSNSTSGSSSQETASGSTESSSADASASSTGSSTDDSSSGSETSSNESSEASNSDSASTDDSASASFNFDFGSDSTSTDASTSTSASGSFDFDFGSESTSTDASASTSASGSFDFDFGSDSTSTDASASTSASGSFDFDFGSESTSASASGSFNFDFGSDSTSTDASGSFDFDFGSDSEAASASASASKSALDSASASFSFDSESASEVSSADASTSGSFNFDFGSESESASDSASTGDSTSSSSESASAPGSSTYSVHQSTQQESIDDVTQSSTPATKTVASKTAPKKSGKSSELESDDVLILP